MTGRSNFHRRDSLLGRTILHQSRLFVITGILLIVLSTLVLTTRPGVKEIKVLIHWWDKAVIALLGSSDYQANARPLQPVRLSRAAGPLQVDPENTRYFTDGSGKAILLAGSHTWDNRQDMGGQAFNYAEYLRLLEQWNHNFVRLWVWEQPKGITTDPGPADPEASLMPELFVRVGPRIASDGGLKFDLTRYNQPFFDRLRQRIIEAGDRGIYVSIMLFDGWSVEQKGGGANPWLYHPFNKDNNINGIDGDPDGDQSGSETQTLQLPAVTRIQEAYVRKVIDTVNDLDNVLYEISNESNPDSKDWQYHMVNYIKSYEATKAKRHPVGITFTWFNDSDPNETLLNSPADWISPGSYYSNPPPADGEKVIINDTDHIWGIGGDRDWAWKSFTRGLNVIYMDPWDGQVVAEVPDQDLRLNLGYILTYANRIDLVNMTPLPDLCSTKYCLADPVPTGAEYLVYLPMGTRVTAVLNNLGIDKDPEIYLPSDSTVAVDLSGTPGQLNVEWFKPEDGMTIAGGITSGGSTKSFDAPFSGDAVLYIYSSAP